jgi:hypothetical protein
MIADALARRDPTRSARFRQAGRTMVVQRVFSLHRDLRNTLQEHDLIGLRENELPEYFRPFAETPDNKYVRSGMLLEEIIDNQLARPPEWLRHLISASVRDGVAQAGAELKVDVSWLDPRDVVNLLSMASATEVVGIAGETKRRVMRHVLSAIQTKALPEALMRELRLVLEKITKFRLHLLVNTSVVRAVNHGKLFTYRQSGVKQVGIRPEWLPPKHEPPKKRLRDAFRDRRKGVDLVVEVLEELQQAIEEEDRKRQEAERKARLEETLGAGSLVNVLTAGDDKVCDECDDIAAQGPYSLDEASDLIPAHPNCRCAFVPWGDARFAAIEEQEE